MSATANRSVIWVCGGDGYPPQRVLAGLTDAGAVVATVYLRGGPLSDRPDLLIAAQRLGPVIAVDSVSEIPTVGPRLGREWTATPVLAFSDDVLVAALRLGNSLGWTDVDAWLADRVRHKFRARVLMAEAGIGGPPFALIRSVADIDVALARVGVPGVVKPVYGAGSCWVFRIDDPADLEPLVTDSWSEMARDDYVERSQMAQDTGFVYEGLLAGTGDTALPAASPLADYCSVEGIVCGGAVTVLGVSDRFVPEPPFRETGVVFPSCRPKAELAPAIELARRVVDAVGMVSGAFHIELKFTPAGPVVIECNPRPGGPVPLMWERLTGRNFATAYLHALHGDPSLFDAPLAGACGEHLIYPPGDAAGVVTRLDGIDGLARLPGVDGVERWLTVGDLANPHEGDYSAVARAWSWAPEPAAVAGNDRRIRDSVDIAVLAAPAVDDTAPVLEETR